MKRLVEYLVEVSKEPEKEALLRKYPDLALKDANLSEEDKALVRSGDWKKIKTIIGDEEVPPVVYYKRPVDLREFIEDLSKDPGLREAFERNSTAVLQDVDLAAEDKQLFLKQDWTAIRKKLEGDEPPPPPVILWSDKSNNSGS